MVFSHLSKLPHGNLRLAQEYFSPVGGAKFQPVTKTWNQPKPAKPTNNHQQNQPKPPTIYLNTTRLCDICVDGRLRDYHVDNHAWNFLGRALSCFILQLRTSH